MKLTDECCQTCQYGWLSDRKRTGNTMLCRHPRKQLSVKGFGQKSTRVKTTDWCDYYKRNDVLKQLNKEK